MNGTSSMPFLDEVVFIAQRVIESFTVDLLRYNRR